MRAGGPYNWLICNPKDGLRDMAEVNTQRRLAAILAADVAGYSRLVSVDENGTLAAFRSHLKEFIEPAFAEFNGRLFKTMGDGLLAEFASVVEAVECAVAFQEGMAQRNADVHQDQKIIFRIGINLGDVVVQDDDVFGDGVNVAARLEGLAEPGRHMHFALRPRPSPRQTQLRSRGLG